LEEKREKEHFILVYNNDLNSEYDNYLTPMDAFVYTTMKLMAGSPYGMDVLYATPDSICVYALGEDCSKVPQRFVRDLRVSLKRIANNGYFPYVSDRRQVFDVSTFRKRDAMAKDGIEKFVMIPISSYKKIFQAFGLTETLKVKVFYFYLKLTRLIGFRTGVCTYSLDIISEKTGVSKRTVQNYIKTLELYRVITVYHMGKNVNCYANYPTNVIGQYYNREKVLQYGKDIYKEFCSKYRLDEDGNKKSQQASA
jgi:hypothetical protein